MHEPNDPFAKQLDDMLAKADLDAKVPEAAPDTLPSPQPPEAAPAAPPEPEDPLAKYIGKTGAEAERKDPWAAFLDSAIEEEGLSLEQEVVKVPEADQHQWEADREALFEGEAYKVTCQKCFRSMEVTREETLGQAMQRHLIAADCALTAVDQVLAS